MDRFTKYIPLNFALLANPVNWLIVALVVMLGGAAFIAILSSTGSNFAKENADG